MGDLRFGRFEVTGVLGEGGMGVVYDARDPDLDRRVAIKLIHEPDINQSIRLLREAQALARLQHPNVVAVHEVGRHEDQVFVAMERVDGVSLDKLSPRPTSWREVVRLFVQAGRGVAAAHDKGLIHRDIKPQNLLVDRDGRVRVGDFGLVRLADGPLAPGGEERAAAPEVSASATTVGSDEEDDASPPRPTAGAGALGSALTRAEAYLGTPRYMSPEQHQRRPATARSDQFSFCVAMWETLFGEHPFEVEAKDAVTGNRRRPVPRGKAPGWLVAALERGLAIDPEQRHPTVIALVEVLERTPVRRRRMTVALIAAAVLVAVGAFSVDRILREKALAERERRLAQQHRAEAEELMEFMLGDLTDKLRPLGKLEVLDAVARKARAYYQLRPAIDGQDQRNRAIALNNVGDVLMAQGDAPAALDAYREAFAIAARLAVAAPADARAQRDVSYGHHKIGIAMETLGDTPGALSAFRASLAIDEAVAASHPDDLDAQYDVSASHEKIGEVLLKTDGDAAAALVVYRKALAIRETLLAGHPEHSRAPGWQRALSASHDQVGEALLATGDTTAALAAFERSLALVETLAVREPGNADWQQAVAISHAKVGNARSLQGDAGAALTSMRASLAIFEKLAAQDPTDAGRRRYVASIQSWIGDVLFEEKDLAAALGAFEASRTTFEQLAALDPDNASWRSDVAIGHEKVGDVQLAREDAAGALATYREAFAIVDKLEDADQGSGRLERMRAVYHDKIGDALVAQDQVDAALVEHRKALAIAVELNAKQPSNTEWRRDVALGHRKIGDALAARGDGAAAAAELRAGLAIMEALAAQDPSNAQWTADVVALRAALARAR